MLKYDFIKTYDDLVAATEAFPDVREKTMIFISKGGFTETVRRRAEEEGVELVEVRGCMMKRGMDSIDSYKIR